MIVRNSIQTVQALSKATGSMILAVTVSDTVSRLSLRPLAQFLEEDTLEGLYQTGFASLQVETGVLADLDAAREAMEGMINLTCDDDLQLGLEAFLFSAGTVTGYARARNVVGAPEVAVPDALAREAGVEPEELAD